MFMKAGIKHACGSKLYPMSKEPFRLQITIRILL